FAEDLLTDRDLDMICGTYELESLGKGHQKSLVSWFPQPDIWFASSYSVGKWTNECELWFQ
ncbi:hypothetical protein CPB83DRAFT_744486, partial [Crepidotus variabilis]